MKRVTGNRIVDLSFDFALRIISFTEILEEERKYAVATQLIRCGTSIGANISEAQSSESKADFIHKLKVASKESEETEYWLLLCKYSTTYPTNEELLSMIVEIKKLLTSIINSSKKQL
ncbi:MAG: four helix bundle protein [Dysgonamonadaceae bacterium]|jgi:four helix bundle protein|nr:four helix bundle protein [Dysgonamonadaceae bacterium]